MESFAVMSNSVLGLSSLRFSWFSNEFLRLLKEHVIKKPSFHVPPSLQIALAD